MSKKTAKERKFLGLKIPKQKTEQIDDSKLDISIFIGAPDSPTKRVSENQKSSSPKKHKVEDVLHAKPVVPQKIDDFFLKSNVGVKKGLVKFIPQIKEGSQENTGKELLKVDINNIFVNILDQDRKDFSIDFEFNPRKCQGKVIFVARPKVTMSYTQQGRHVVPYAFMEWALQSILTNMPENTDSERVMEYIVSSLLKLLFVMIRERDGAAIPSSVIKDDKALQEVLAYSSKVIKDEGQMTFLVSPSKKTVKLKKLSEVSQQNYNEEFKLFTHSIINKLMESSKGQSNARTIIIEDLVAQVLIEYNKALGTTYPKEGNSRPFEIRLYPNKKSATDKSENYSLVSIQEIKARLDLGEDLNGKIRLVNCQGPDIVRSKKIFTMLSEMLSCIAFGEMFGQDPQIATDKKLKDIIDEYNKEYAKNVVVLTNFTTVQANELMSEYIAPISTPPKMSEVVNQIAKNLFFLFDYKALEKLVFDKASKGDVFVYKGAVTAKQKGMQLVDGEDYRANEVRKASGYNKTVIFRNEEKITEQLLAEKIFKAVLILASAFNVMRDQKVYEEILKSFANIVAIEHGFVKHDELDKYLNIKLQQMRDSDKDYEVKGDIDIIFNHDVKSSDFEVSGAIIATHDNYMFEEIS